MEHRLTLTVDETAAALGKSQEWVRDQIKSGDIPHVRIGGSILIPVAALQRRVTPDEAGAGA